MGNICVAAALRRGIVDETEAGRLGLASSNLQQGTAFLVVTHDLQLAKRMSRQLEMRDGRLTAELSLMGAE